jgi:predicted porin
VNYTWDKYKVSVSQVNLRYDNSQFASIIADDLVITNAGIKYQVTAPLWIGVSYTVAKDTVNTANSSSTIGIAANYELSKRTSLYALAGTTSNSGASAMTPLYGASATGTAGVDNTAYAVGLRHIF